MVAIAAIAAVLASAAHECVNLAVDGAHQELLVPEDAEDDEARPRGARLGAHRRGPLPHGRHDGGEEVLQELGRLHLDRSIDPPQKSNGRREMNECS